MASRLGLPSGFSFRQTTGNFAEVVAKGFLNSVILALSVTVFMVFLLGSYDYFKNVEENKCEMTYMFEYPEYIRIKLDSPLDKKYPQYGLYAYAEGRHVVAAKRHKFTGIPVLFIPGNAGSHKQIRSFASVALRKWLDSKTPYHFDFFSLDFNEELSGLYGYVLPRQSEYMRGAMERIQSFYEEYHSIVLIGHSMGGIVAKVVGSNGEPLSNLIITLSAPHSRPILLFDPEQDLFYFNLSRSWTFADEKVKKDVTLVSVSGGDRDVLVPEGFTKWGKHLDLHASTSGVPGVWASTDHLCVVWCKQFVFSVVRSLFDLVEYRKQNGFYAISQDSEFRRKVLSYHFEKKTSGKSIHGAHRETEMGKPPGTLWNELISTSYCSQPSRSTTYVMFPMQIIQERVKGDPEDYRLLLLTTNTDAKNWVFGCTSQSFIGNVRYCSASDNLSELGEIIPHFRRRRKVVHLKYSDIKKYSHIVVRMEPMNVKSCVNLEVYDDTERSREIITKFETQEKIFYNFSLPMDKGIFSKLIAWRIEASTGNGTCDSSHNSLAVFQHGSFKMNRFPRNETLIARFSDWNASSANVQLYLEPTCKYNVRVLLAGLETAGQIFRTYFRLIPSFFGSIVLMSLYFQKDGNDWKNFHRVLFANSYYLTIVPGFLVSLLLTVVPNDWPHMLDGPEYFVILPMFCYLVAYTMVLLVGAGAWYIIIASGNAVHSIFLRMVTTRFAKWTNLRAPMPDQIADMALEFTFAKLPMIIAVFLVSMTLATCGSFGLLAGLCFYVIKLFKMYEDILGDLWRARIRDVAEGLSPLNFQFSFAMIWFFLTVLNFPSLIHWVKSFSDESASQWDISMYYCLMVLPTIAVLWQDKVPRFNETLWKLHRFVFYGMGLAMVIWGTFRLYVSCFILLVVFITTAICQLISFIPIPQDEEQTTEKVKEANGTVETPKDPGTEEEVDSETEIEGYPETRPTYEKLFQRERETHPDLFRSLKDEIEDEEASNVNYDENTNYKEGDEEDESESDSEEMPELEDNTDTDSPQKGSSSPVSRNSKPGSKSVEKKEEIQDTEEVDLVVADNTDDGESAMRDEVVPQSVRKSKSASPNLPERDST